ncbi:hypothetical protein L1987_75885 [Smallanthus sonchifolius]|uniref:Uncharacterized protein n=1 Tax=Smallanthus sonchifolius TaxID=185202 RepID=A0ACB9A7B6_9ASTR|nr:hypothetical protein L1987_75885 [Smallanthus sonchifolius]
MQEIEEKRMSLPNYMKKIQKDVTAEILVDWLRLQRSISLYQIPCSSQKFEEVSSPHVEDYCYIIDNTHTKEEVVQMLINFFGTRTEHFKFCL